MTAIIVFTNIIAILKNLIIFHENQSVRFQPTLLIIWMNLLSLKHKKKKQKRKKTNIYNQASELYIDLLAIYFDKNYELSDAKRKTLESKYDPDKLFLETCNSDVWFENEKLIDKEESADLSDQPALEGDEKEVKEKKGLKILTPNKLLTRLPVLLAQTKAGNNSCKLKNEVRKILYFLYQHNKITKKVFKNSIKSL